MSTVSKFTGPGVAPKLRTNTGPENMGTKLVPKESDLDKKKKELQEQYDNTKQITSAEQYVLPMDQWDKPYKKKYGTRYTKHDDPEIAKMKSQNEFSSAARGLDIIRGRETGREMFQDQLGRVEEPRSEAMAALLGKRKEQSEQGLGAEAFQGAREQRLRGLQGSDQMQNRALAASQAKSGIRGGAAQGQLAELMGQQGRNRQGAEQDLLLADVALKQGLTDKYGQELKGVEAGELDRQKFNLNQVGKEKFGELATGLSEGSMGVAERTGIRQAETSKAMAQAMAAANSGGGGSSCCSILAITSFGLGGIDSAKAQDIVIGSKTDKASVIEKYQHDSDAMEAIGMLGKVRFVRDNHTTTKQLRGYYKFSELTVPYIKKSPILSKVGYKLMVQPIADYSIIGKLWIKFWGFFGSEKQFVRSNGEIV